MDSIKEIARQFDLSGDVIDIKPLKIGHINDSYIITAQDGGATKKYFLQKINTSIFKDVDLLQDNISKVTSHIRKCLEEAGACDIDRKVMGMIPSKKDGKLYAYDTEGNAWRVYTFIPDSHSRDEVTPDTAYLAGKAFGNFQNMLASLPAEELKETIPNFHNIEYRMWELHQAISNDKANRANLPESQRIINELLRREEDMCLPERLHREGKLPKRINHCDAKVNNMLLNDKEEPMAIVDLDTVMPSFVLSDYGDFMRTGANTGAEDDANLDNIGVDFPVFEAFTKGYLEEANFLTDIERELLPFGAKLLSYMQAVRFFTDYLNGDTYYKIAHPEHNLQRTLAQLRLLEEQEANFERMKEIVNGCGKKQLAIKRLSNIEELSEQLSVEIACNNWKQYDIYPKASFKMALCDDKICIEYKVKESNPRAVNHNDQEPVWEDSCVEFFCQVPGDSHYFNFEFNSLGTCVSSRRKSRKEDVQPLGAEQLSKIKRHTQIGDNEWILRVEIPLELIAGKSEEKPKRLKANFYKCGDRTEHPHYLSWSPICLPKPDFHCPAFFGEVIID